MKHGFAQNYYAAILTSPACAATPQYTNFNAALGEMGGAGNHEPIAMSFSDKAVSDEQFPMHVHTYMSGSPSPQTCRPVC